MLTTIEGVYKNGRIELSETPAQTEEARVLVTFLPSNGSEQNGEQESAQAKARREAGERLIARMEEGLPLGGGPYYKNREELYAERIDRW